MGCRLRHGEMVLVLEVWTFSPLNMRKQKKHLPICTFNVYGNPEKDQHIHEGRPLPWQTKAFLCKKETLFFFFFFNQDQINNFRDACSRDLYPSIAGLSLWRDNESLHSNPS